LLLFGMSRSRFPCGHLFKSAIALKSVAGSATNYGPLVVRLAGTQSRS
jgi:hypothetical protein